MPWGSPAVTRRRFQQDAAIAFAQGNTTASLQHVGLMKSILFRYNSTFAYTKSVGGSLQDAMGPFNSVSNIQIKANGIGIFCDVPAWMLYLYNLVHYRDHGFDPASSDNVGILQTTAATNLFSFPAVPGATGPLNILWGLRYPFSVDIMGVKEVGLFVLQNDEINVQVTPSFNASAMTATKLAQPYVLAGGDSMTIGAPSLSQTREFYAVPASEKDYPVVGWFHQIENQVVAMTSTTTEIAHPKGGIILRAIYQAVDGTGPNLMNFATAGTAPAIGINRLKWVYGSNEVPYDETIDDVLWRQRRLYGHDLPQGAVVHDFFGEGYQTLRDAFDTQQYQNLRTQIITNNTPAAGSYVWCTRERLIPIGNVAESLY